MLQSTQNAVGLAGQRASAPRRAATGAVDPKPGEALLRALLADDSHGWEKFYRAFQPLIRKCVMRILECNRVPFTTEDLQDFVAEVWVALLRHDRQGLRKYDPERGRSLTSWLRLLATRSTIDQLRRRYTIQRLREHGGELDELGHTSFEPEWQLEQSEQAELAREAIAELKPQELCFLTQCVVEEIEPRILAQRFGISVGTVHTRKFKLRSKLERIVRRRRKRAAVTAACAGHA